MNSAIASSRVANPTATTGSNTRLESTLRSPQGRFVPIVGTLRLRAEPAPRRGIRWAEDVIDNEGLGRKSSKVCCIYHKPRGVGESSSEDDSDSSSDSDSDSEPDNSTARKAKSSKRDHHDHDHEHGKDCGHDHPESSSTMAKRKSRGRKKSPNAYEKVPKRSSTVMQTTK